jgi:three-Cys-motif partner protein
MELLVRGSMAKPKTPLWDADEHTLAKHVTLREYLEAWLPIMSRYNKNLLLIDGFAGPGRYLGGEEGSPLIMLRTLLDHRDFASMAGTTFTFLFIEQDRARIDWLRGELAALGTLPPNVRVIGPIQANFSDVMENLLAHIKPLALVPTFAFIDPFGYKDTTVGLSGRILSFPKSEVLIYLPLYNIARFVNEPAQERALTNLFGDDSWKAAKAIDGFENKQDVLHDLFAAALGKHATYVRSFEMMGKATNTGYHLFFASSSETGLRKMKAAMWQVDASGGTSFRDSTIRGQGVLFKDEPDYSALLRLLQERFGDGEFTIEEAERFTLVQTPFRDDGHLKSPTLRPAEKAGLLTARNADLSKRRAGFYPAGTVLRFTPAAVPERAIAPGPVASRSTRALPAAVPQSSRSVRPTA